MQGTKILQMFRHVRRGYTYCNLKEKRKQTIYAKLYR
nr:MAG TPA: hypothetical protein [Caudoviricetes sp.]